MSRMSIDVSYCSDCDYYYAARKHCRCEEDKSPVVVKEGETYTLWCCTHDLQSKRQDTLKADCDMTEKDMEGIAEDYFWNEKEPEWGWSVDTDE